MDVFDLARSLYREAKLVLDLTRDLAAANDALRWARDDLEEDLLDLKLAVIESNLGELPELIFAVQRMINVVLRAIDPPEESGEEP